MVALTMGTTEDLLQVSRRIGVALRALSLQ